MKDADKYIWTEKEEAELENIKAEWSEKLETHIPNENDIFTLETDA